MVEPTGRLRPGPSPHGEQGALRLAGITRLSLGGRGPREAFVFDPHRLALPSWALALQGKPQPALLLTLDRHFDLVPPPPDPLPDARDVLAVDAYARRTLDIRNVDHILAAADLGLVGDILAVARSRPRGALDAPEWRDRSGQLHRIVTAPTLERLVDLCADRGSLGHTLLSDAKSILLDVDLDCFTTPSDADATALVPWPRGLIHDFLFPPDSGPFWEQLLPRCVALTLAREPYHCGGLVAAGRLFEQAAAVLFEELLQTDLP